MPSWKKKIPQLVCVTKTRKWLCFLLVVYYSCLQYLQKAIDKSTYALSFSQTKCVYTRTLTKLCTLEEKEYAPVLHIPPATFQAAAVAGPLGAMAQMFSNLWRGDAADLSPSRPQNNKHIR